MSLTPLHAFDALTAVCWATVVFVAASRSRAYAVFVGTLLGVYSLSALTLAPTFRPLLPLYAAFHLTVYVNFLALSRPRMRPFPYRLLISWPSAFFAAGTLLALPWAVATALGFSPWAPWLPYALGAIGLVQSLTTKRELVHLVVGGPGGARAEKLAPYPRGETRETRPLRIVQISDPHLGPFMSVTRLRKLVKRAVDADPDLVLLTGDFLTMESQRRPGAAPLRSRTAPSHPGAGVCVPGQPRSRGA